MNYFNLSLLEHINFVKKLDEIKTIMEFQDKASIGDVIYSFAQRAALHQGAGHLNKNILNTVLISVATCLSIYTVVDLSQAYIKFMTNYASNESSWKNLAARQSIDDFLTDVYSQLSREDPPIKQRVEDMLGTIRDRFYKYKMFTERLVKDTPEHHDDHKEILKAEREIGVILTRLDREVKVAQKDARNLVLVSLIEKAFENDFSASGISVNPILNSSEIIFLG